MQQQITKPDMQKISKLRDSFIHQTRQKQLYPFQKEISNRIIESVLLNRGETIVVEICRQAGKTEAVADSVAFLDVWYFPLMRSLNLPTRGEFQSILFAPQKEQAKTDFDRIKDALAPYQSELDIEFEESNGTTINLGNGCRNFCFSLSPTSHPESKTADLIIFEEAQDIEDVKVDKTAMPMAAATNATIVFIGTAGYKKCKFYDLIEKDKEVLKFPYPEVIRQKQEAYKKDDFGFHLNYERHIGRELKALGKENDEFRTQYALEWVLEKGQFITFPQLMALEGNYDRVDKWDKPVLVGIDWAKTIDSSVVTVVDSDSLKILNWYEYQGDDYKFQFQDILSKLQNFDVERVTMDSTGTQDMMADWFRADTGYSVDGVPFSPQHKDAMYRNLSRFMYPMNIIHTNLSVKFPKTDCVEKDKFVKQFMDLQKEMKNNMWSCNHPEGRGYHDDYTDSLALAIYSTKENQEFFMLDELGDYFNKRMKGGKRR